LVEQEGLAGEPDGARLAVDQQDGHLAVAEPLVIWTDLPGWSFAR
jgi:hypothetical protein